VPVQNLAIASILEEIGDRLAIQRANPFRIRAYHNAARLLQGLGDDVKQMIARGDDLTRLPGYSRSFIIALKAAGLTSLIAFLSTLMAPCSCKSENTRLTVSNVRPR
jgi:DNA polymerase (family X)